MIFVYWVRPVLKRRLHTEEEVRGGLFLCARAEQGQECGGWGKCGTCEGGAGGAKMPLAWGGEEVSQRMGDDSCRPSYT